MKAQSGQVLVFILAIIIILIGGGTVAYLVIEKELINLAVDAPTTVETTTSRTLTYTDQSLGFRFDYPRNSLLEPCSDGFCQTIAGLSFKAIPLNASFFPTGTVEIDLSSRDLYCNVSSNLATTWVKTCTLNQIQKFTNKNNVRGFVLSRQVKIQNDTTQIFSDRAYGFLLKNSQYPALLLTVDLPTSANLSTLDKIANSFTLVQ